MPKSFRFILVCLVVVTALVGGAFLMLKSWLYSGIGPYLDTRLEALNVKGFNVRYDSISADWLRGRITLHRLAIDKNSYDTTCLQPEFIAAQTVSAGGINLIRLLIQNTLEIASLEIEGLSINMRDGQIFSSEKGDEISSKQIVEIGAVTIKDGHVTHLDNTNCNLLHETVFDAAAQGIVLKFQNESSPTWYASTAEVSDIDIHFPQAYYRVKLPRAHLSWHEQKLQIDTVRITPTLNKATFGQAYGREVDRFEVTIPFLRIDGFRVSNGDSTFVNANTAEVQFYLKVFRDKNLPDSQQDKPLPVEVLRQLPFPLRIDTLRVIHSYAEYEERIQGSPEPGKLYFDNLYATFHNIGNYQHSGCMAFSARSNLSGHGNLGIRVWIPYEADKATVLRGTISNFPMPEINSILTPSTNISIESGTMDDLSFSFSYNDSESSGKILLNYRDLKLAKYKNSKNDEATLQKDNLGTFLMNTFIFRKHMTDDIPEERRTGSIAYRRDARRSVFNYWVKSITSGIISAFNLLDTEEMSKTQTELKHQDKFARREARKD